MRSPAEDSDTYLQNQGGDTGIKLQLHGAKTERSQVSWK